MKLTQNKYGVPSFRVDETDCENAIEIEKMMQMPGWNILKDIEKEAREHMIQSGKDCAKSVERKELSIMRWAYIDGFDECRIVADNFVRNVKLLIEERNKENED